MKNDFSWRKEDPWTLLKDCTRVDSSLSDDQHHLPKVHMEYRRAEQENIKCTYSGISISKLIFRLGSHLPEFHGKYTLISCIKISLLLQFCSQKFSIVHKLF